MPEPIQNSNVEQPAEQTPPAASREQVIRSWVIMSSGYALGILWLLTVKEANYVIIIIGVLLLALRMRKALPELRNLREFPVRLRKTQYRVYGGIVMLALFGILSIMHFAFRKSFVEGSSSTILSDTTRAK